MDYKTILIVVVLLGLPTIVLVVAKLISIIRQRGLGSTELESTAFNVDRESGEVEFGDGEHGRRPPASNDGIESTYEHGAGSSPSAESALTAREVYDYLEDAVICHDPAGKESSEKLSKQGESSDGSSESKKSE